MVKHKKLHPYKTGIFHWIPGVVKIHMLKWWAAGIVYYFVGFGSSFLAQGSFEMMFSIGAVLGLVNSYVVSRIVRDTTHLEDRDNPHLAVRRKGPVATLINILLSVLLVILIGFTYEGINLLFIFLFDLEKLKIYIPADPIGFALLYIGFDYLWCRITFRPAGGS